MIEVSDCNATFGSRLISSDIKSEMSYLMSVRLFGFHNVYSTIATLMSTLHTESLATHDN